jgi:hypothetical protein
VNRHPLELTRDQILSHRRRVNDLDERLPSGSASLERAAWLGLTDSMPRAALLSIHARVSATEPSTWEDPALVQVWGPRFSAYVIAARDRAVFTLGRLPTDGPKRRRAEETADRLDAFLAGRRMSYAEAGHGMNFPPNMLRYATTTGRVLIRWEGAARPTVWTVPSPEMDARDARLELARRYLTGFGPGTAAGFGAWAGMQPANARASFEALASEMLPARSPAGDGWLLATDEPSFTSQPSPAAAARLLPSGDSWFLLWGRDRSLLVPDAKLLPLLWTSRVWPGALLIDGEVAGTWRRSNADLAISPWRRLSPTEVATVEAEAAALPIPGFVGRIATRWED